MQMPQATAKLREKFWDMNAQGIATSDGIYQCENILKKYGIRCEKCVIDLTEYEIDRELNDEINDAIEFLVDEWDYEVK